MKQERSAPKRYWQSLEQLEGQAPTWDGEFPPGAAEPPEGISRRTMVGLLGASLSMAGVAGCRRPVETIVPYVKAPEEVIPGVPRAFATTMPFGLSSLGVVVESHEGRPTKIEGNELHPASAGATNARAQASILQLYDPDRSKVVRRDQARATWKEFTAAWAALEGEHLGDGGAGLAVLSESFSSPTLARLFRSFGERFPAARWACFEPISDESLHHGLERATGAAYLPTYHFDRARTILSLDADFLAEGDDVVHIRRFADGHQPSSHGDDGTMSRLYVVEGVHSLTGSNADRRFRLPSSRVGDFAYALMEELVRQGLELEVPSAVVGRGEGIDPAWIRAVAADLIASRSEGVVLAGPRQPSQLHAMVFMINQALGNNGSTISYYEPVDAKLPRTAELVDLTAAMHAGEVSTLVVLGGNPAYNAPADLDFEGALGQVEQVIHLGPYRDETARLAHWHIPETHYLEAWGDARAVDGTASVVQPLIEPLFGGKSAVELLGVLASGFAQPGYDLVRESWRSLLAGGDFERRWRRVLHDGLLAESAFSAAKPFLSPGAFDTLAPDLPAATALGEQELELVFQPSPAVFDGRFANNGWLQELPDSLTKLTWDNAALLSPKAAEALGVGNEEVVRLSYDGRELEMPVWIVPGQADSTVCLHLGYGRRAGGRIAVGRGFDTYRLRSSGAMGFARGLDLSPTGGRYELAQTQDHHSMEGRDLVREEAVADYRGPSEADHSEGEHGEGHGARAMWKEWSYDEGYQWGMTIDLSRCVGCNACVVACQSENNIPIVGKEQVREGREMHWIRVDRYFSGGVEDPETVFQPIPCMQCENAPCEQVCPVSATVHDAEGLNVMVYNRCIGTRYCLNNCPYKVRRFNFFSYTKDTPEVLQLASNPDVTVRSRGVMEKCTYCTQRINAGKISAKLEGRELADGDIRSACQQVCPAGAIEFGNLNDPTSRVAAAKHHRRNYAILDKELYTKPRTTFLSKLRNPSPELEDA